MINNNVENMLEELKEKYPDNYKVGNILIRVVDKNGNYDDDTGFDESQLWEVRIFYRDKLFTIKREYRDLYRDLFEMSDDNYLYIEDLDELGKIINIIGKHLKRISYKWD